MLRNRQGEPLDAAQAFRKAADYCALQERCLEEMRLKMRQWSINKELIESTLDRLIDEGFIDEQRFATAFAQGKFRMLEWGKIKISIELRMRKIPSAFIAKALDDIDEAEYLETIKSLIAKRLHGSHNPSREEINKAMNYLAGKGFEPELVRNMIKDDY